MEPFVIVFLVCLFVFIVWCIVGYFTRQARKNSNRQTYNRQTHYPPNINKRYYVTTNNRVYHETVPDNRDGSTVVQHLVTTDIHVEDGAHHVGAHNIAAGLGSDFVGGNIKDSNDRPSNVHEIHVEHNGGAGLGARNIGAGLGSDFVGGILKDFFKEDSNDRPSNVQDIHVEHVSHNVGAGLGAQDIHVEHVSHNIGAGLESDFVGGILKDFFKVDSNDRPSNVPDIHVEHGSHNVGTGLGAQNIGAGLESDFVGGTFKESVKEDSIEPPSYENATKADRNHTHDFGEGSGGDANNSSEGGIGGDTNDSGGGGGRCDTNNSGG